MRSLSQKCSLKIDSFSSAAMFEDFCPSSNGRIDARHFRSDESADGQSALLIENIRHTLAIHAEMFRRILEATPCPSPLLAELFEDTGKRYLDFSELVSAEFKRAPTG